MKAKAWMLVLGMEACLVTGVVLAQSAANPYFSTSVAVDDDCAIEGALAENSAHNRDTGATHEQELARFQSYHVGNTNLERSRAAADLVAINFAFAHPQMSADAIRDAVNKQCHARAASPTDYAGKDPAVFH